MYLNIDRLATISKLCSFYNFLILNSERNLNTPNTFDKFISWYTFFTLKLILYYTCLWLSPVDVIGESPGIFPGKAGSTMTSDPVARGRLHVIVDRAY